MPSPIDNHDAAVDVPERDHPVIWAITFALTGIGSIFLGSLLPRMSTLWQLRDGQAGMLVAALFVGSFTGSLLLPERLGRSLHRGAWCASAGFGMFAACVSKPHTFAPGLFSLFVAGFGMGQLMSSINLIVGQSRTTTRSGTLSRLAAIWCVGAVVSTLFTSVLFPACPLPVRILVLAALFLLPATVTRVPHPASEVGAMDAARFASGRLRTPARALFFTSFFFLYGGVEASITGWMAIYSIRYGVTGLATGQWVVSLLWIGIAAGRLAASAFMLRMGEMRLLRCAFVCSALSLSSLLVFHRPNAFAASLVLTGLSLGPMFPVTLSLMIGHALPNRSAGLVLAGCALGAAVLPWMVGELSTFTHSLQAAMLLPLAGLILLFCVLPGMKPRASRHLLSN